MFSQLKSKLTNFGEEKTGAIAMEFALVVPALALMFLGSAGVFDHYRIKKRAAVAADTISDLMARSLQMDDVEKNVLYDAARLMMGNYADNIRLKMVMTAYQYDEDENQMVIAWTRGCNMEPYYTAGDTFSAGNYPVVQDGEMLMHASIEFDYKSPLYFVASDKVSFQHEATRKPRYSAVIDYVIPEGGSSSESDTNCEA